MKRMELDDITICSEPLPSAVKAFARQRDNGEYCIVVNAYLDSTAQKEAIEHELKHIRRNDFNNDLPVRMIEAMI